MRKKLRKKLEENLRRFGSSKEIFFPMGDVRDEVKRVEIKCEGKLKVRGRKT